MGQGRLPLYIGARISEALGLRREHVHGARAVLPDSKSGPRTIWLPTPARAVLGPRARQIKPAVDQRLPKMARVGENNTDPAVLDTTRRPRILAGNADRMPALLHEARLIDHQHAVRAAQRLKRIGSDLVPQCLGIPAAAAQRAINRSKTQL